MKEEKENERLRSNCGFISLTIISEHKIKPLTYCMDVYLHYTRLSH